jgi:hypothetical protein
MEADLGTNSDPRQVVIAALLRQEPAGGGQVSQLPAAVPGAEEHKRAIPLQKHNWLAFE